MSAPLICCNALQIGWTASRLRLEVSFEVSTGERIAVVGPAGAGKSTLLQTIAGMVAPLGGNGQVIGCLLGATPLHILARAGLAYVGDDRGVFLTLSIREHVELAQRRRYTVERGRETTSPLMRLADHPEVKVVNLSGGERQVLGIGCALSRKPKLLVVDQLTQGVQSEVRAALVKRVLDRCERDGLAILFADNDDSVVDLLSSRILKLEGLKDIATETVHGEPTS